LSRPEASNTNTKGILLKVISVGFFVVMAALIKESSKMVPAGEAVFFGHSSHYQLFLGGFGCQDIWLLV
jgi:hypothetical protein